MRRRKTGKERWEGVWKALRNPPNWVAVLVVATALIVCPLIVFALTSKKRHIVAIVVSSALCALLLAYTVAVVVWSVGKIRNKVLTVANRYEFTRNLKENYEFRTMIFGVYSFLCNAGYTVFLMVMAFHYRSVWYGTIGLYYILLCVTRGGVIWQNRNDEKKYRQDYHALQNAKLGTYRYCAVMVVVLACALSFSVLELVWHSSGFRHAVWLIYVFGAVAVYKIISAIVHLIHATKRDDLVIRSVRYINLAVTLMSVLCLQTAIVAAYPIGAKTAAWINGVTGAVVCLLTLTLGIYMFVFSARAKKRALAQEIQMMEERSAGRLEGYNRDGYQIEK